MVDQSSRFRKYGIYTMDVRKRGMGMVPAASLPPGYTPTISTGAQQQSVPGSTPAPSADSMPIADVQAIAAAMMAFINEVNSPQWVDTPEHKVAITAPASGAVAFLNSAIKSAGRAGSSMVSSSFVYQVITAPSLNSDIRGQVNNFLAQASQPTLEQFASRISSGYYASTVVRSGATYPSVFQPTNMTTTAPPVTTPTQTPNASATPGPVLDSQLERNTQITAGGQSPYYGPGTVDPTLASQPPPSSSMPSWLVPVLAVMGGAALGAVTIRAVFGSRRAA